MRTSLASLTLRGFKTIRELEEFEPGQLTVLIGPNGAGKTNLLAFFRMLSRTVAPPGDLQAYIAEQGGANSLLHDGPEKTQVIESVLRFQTELGTDSYGFRLHYAQGDTLVFFNEWIRREELGVV
jgi:predicted ATPase